MFHTKWINWRCCDNISILATNFTYFDKKFNFIIKSTTKFWKFGAKGILSDTIFFLDLYYQQQQSHLLPLPCCSEKECWIPRLALYSKWKCLCTKGNKCQDRFRRKKEAETAKHLGGTTRILHGQCLICTKS